MSNSTLGNLPLLPLGQAFVDPRTGNLQPSASYFLRVLWARTGSATGGVPESQIPVGTVTTAYVTAAVASGVAGLVTPAELASEFAAPPAIGSTTPAAGSFTTLQASGNDALLYTNASGQSIPSGTPTTVTGWTKVFDRVNANFNATTGVFTAPAAGYYQIAGQITLAASAALVVGATSAVQIIANGVNIATALSVAQTTTSAPIVITIPQTVVSLASGQTLLIQVRQSTGAAVALFSATPNVNFISINRLA